MKILAIQETDWIKRGPHQQHHLLERMSRKGHEVKVIDFEYLWRDGKKQRRIQVRQEFNPPSHIIDDTNITLIRPGIIRVPLIDKMSIFFSHKKEIRKELDEFKPDVVIGFGILNANISLKECKKRDIPFIYYLIDQLHVLLPNDPIREIAKRYEKETLRNADRILVINQGLKDYCTEMGADIDRIKIISTGVDLDVFDSSIEAPDLKREYGIKNEDIVLFFMGWIYEFSGMKEVAKDLVNHDHENVKLMIVGEGDLYDYLCKFRNEQGLGEKLILTGKVPFKKIPLYISMASICLLPAYHNEIMENIVPIKIYEYMAMKKPVISTKLPGIVKEFGYGNGIQYISGPEEVFQKMKELIEMNEIGREGQKARNFVQDLEWDKIVTEFEHYLEKLI